ncbi:hypothetical protein Glove_241g13 [Diversispora epigaea]|uniref:BTB domain-containing protein n=1 Tax=Diversispora epigaea TaxID=1348612 RepID=A0A397II42_9GLOM|nr:hypothetical protein Glove_241g13 [Diversispora epigaea]
MGLLTDQKRVILPIYKPTDHTPSVYKDPHSDRLIPVGYFLNNLDDIGPVHWENKETADFLLRVVSCEEVDYWCEYFDNLSRNLLLYQNHIRRQQPSPQQQSYNNTTQKLNTSSSLPKCNNRNINALEASTLTNYFNMMMFNYQKLLLNNFNLQQQQLQNYYQHNNYDSGLITPPDSPQREEYYCNHHHHNNTSASTPPITNKPTFTNSSNPTSQSSSSLSSSSSYYFYTHTLILASQSGFFNQLLGPINGSTSTTYNSHQNQSPPLSPLSPTSPSSSSSSSSSYSSQFNDSNNFPTTLTIPIPHPECFEIILHWLYHHDDELWLDVITPDNFTKFYENVKFLKLGKEAYDILDSYIAEAEEDGIEIVGEGIVEIY